MSKITVNGFTIIASRQQNDGTHVIMGHYADPHGGHEYVTARMRDLTDSEWYWGEYTHALTSAIDSFNKRSQKPA